MERQVEPFGTQHEVEAVLVVVPGKAAPAFGEAFRVAMRAAGGHMGAARDRIP